jgi:hypothetical protein
MVRIVPFRRPSDNARVRKRAFGDYEGYFNTHIAPVGTLLSFHRLK